MLSISHILQIRLEELVAHDEIINILTKLIDSDKLPHLLFYGPPGKFENDKHNAALCPLF